MLDGAYITRDEALLLYEQPLEDLCNCADKLRRHFCGDNFDICRALSSSSRRSRVRLSRTVPPDASSGFQSFFTQLHSPSRGGIRPPLVSFHEIDSSHGVHPHGDRHPPPAACAEGGVRAIRDARHTAATAGLSASASMQWGKRKMCPADAGQNGAGEEQPGRGKTIAVKTQ